MGWLQKYISKQSPKIFENSNIPAWLSKIAPIEIGAISLLGLIFCRGELSKTQRRHETIHFHQQLELFIFGFFLLYVVFWIRGLAKYKDAKTAYRESPFEREAYANERKYTYLEKRALWSWTAYIKG